MEWLSRTVLLLGEEKVEKLKKSNVLIVGLGGVGAYAAEMIIRAGIGKMTIVDGDIVNATNRNRQLPALISNEGHYKADKMAERLLDINPELNLTVIKEFVKDQRIEDILKVGFDYVVDAIDTLSPKTFLIVNCVKNEIPVVSSMGAGGKFDTTLIEISDISKSYNCNLARTLRKRLHKHGIRKGVKVVFSPENIDKEAVELEESENKKSNVGTISYMPPAFGVNCASVVIRDLIKNN